MVNILEVNHEVVLHQVSYSDAPALFRLIDNNRTSLRAWLPFVDFTKVVEDTEAFIGSFFVPGSRNLVFTIRYRGEVAGLIGYKDIDRNNKKLEIGYWIAPVFEGNGIVTQSLEALIGAAFSYLEMNRIQIKCAVGNQRSINIPKRLAFRFEGIERAGEWLNDRFVDLEVYSMLRSDWIK